MKVNWKQVILEILRLLAAIVAGWGAASCSA